MGVQAGGSAFWARARRYRGHALLGAIVLLLMASAGVTMSARSQKAARDQFERRGRYIARNLAYNARYPVVRGDRKGLAALVEGVRTSAGDVVGVTIVDPRDRVLAHLADPEFPGDLEVREFRAPVASPGGWRGPDVIGEVRVGLPRRKRSARAERQARVDYIAHNLASYMVAGLESNMRTRDAYTRGMVTRSEIESRLTGVMESAQDVAGIVVRGRSGQVLLEKGDSWVVDPSGLSFTNSFQTVVPVRAAVANGAQMPATGDRDAKWEVIGEVEVAVHEARDVGLLSGLRSWIEDMAALLQGTARRLLSHRLPSSMEA